MAIYEVYLSPEAVIQSRNGFPSGLDELHRLQLVRDGGSILAIIFPGIWLIWKRLWFALLVYGLISVGLVFLSQSTQTSLIILTFLLSILPGLYLFLEGSTLLTSRLKRKGWQFIAVVEASSVEMAERRFLNNALKTPVRSMIFDNRMDNHPPTRIAAVNNDERPELGLFSEG